MGGLIFWDGVEAPAGLLGEKSDALVRDDATVVGYSGSDYSTNAWDMVSFDDIPLPGVCEVRGLTKCNVKNKRAPGSKGNKPTVLGYQPTEFDITVTFWTPNQWEIIQDELDRLWNVPMANPKYIGRTQKIDPAQFSHTVDHPALRALKIGTCVINQVGLPKDGKVPGTKVIEIKCTENRDPGKKNTTATPRPGQVKRHKNFNGPQPQNMTPLPPSATPSNMSLTPQLFTPAGGVS